MLERNIGTGIGGEKPKMSKLKLYGMLAAVLIVGGFIATMAYQTHLLNVRDDEFYESVDRWFHDELKANNSMAMSYECGTGYIDCYLININIDDEFDSYSFLDKHDYIVEITDAYDKKRRSSLRDTKKIDDRRYIRWDSPESKVVLITSQNQYSYNGKFTDSDGKVYTRDEISTIKYPESTKKKTEQKITVGMTVEEVEKILGKADETLWTEADSLGDVRYRYFYVGKGYVYFADHVVWQVLFKDYQEP
ncbi:hypothetical protein [Paenibacillus sp. IITD108]|uniref:hypothetical protein n=1 Tax=Paenibacillus sp. IITD108 TaxID=3116649 RepID=UPI002F3F9A42